MANEVQVTARLVDSALEVDHQPSALNVDRTGTEMISYVQSIGTSNEALATNSDIGTVGWAYFENLDSTNFVQLATQDDATYFAKLLAGEKFIIPLATATIYAKADTGAVRLRVTMLER